ncbi:5-deoxy-glucuronate isomerase [Melghirimyces algeriensis]|uniref:5-deoxy-glucuronate isomerase n=1 Tax=Melghirimyces algeriensis TaxID=910412 RepID=A0A521B3Z1_9BACL|nr:5-deoxy-glucuronate isomerase [Melghirimyces algeriensis]SMO41765.1 5-deoxyglucuronate isomerase [Melghirimyces algeriensis]
MPNRTLLARSRTNAEGNDPVVQVTPQSAGWTYTGFEVYRLKEGECFSLDRPGLEQAVIVLEGTCHVSASGERFSSVGSRTSVFDNQSPEAVYCPPGAAIEVEAVTRTEVAVASAVTEEGEGPVRRITPADIPYEERGEGSTRRYIRHILDEHHPAKKLLLVEVLTPSGNWSSYPPHKHDTESENEAYLEETYYHRLNPSQGQAWQRVYDKQGLDEVLTPSDGDVVLVPKGYHPVGVPVGFDSYYLNVMAGHNRTWKFQIDSNFKHIAPKDGNIMGKVEQGK